MHYAQYRFMFSPPANIREQIKYYKAISADKIGAFDSMHSPAHISLPFDEERQKTFVLEPALIRMERSLNSMPPIKLDIIGFETFANHVTGYTIYAAVDMNDKVKNWIKLLFRSMNMKQQTFKPHITIARNINEENYKILWAYFMKQRFKESFEIDELLISKREPFAHDTGWKMFKRIQFLNQLNTPPPVENPTLF